MERAGLRHVKMSNLTPRERSVHAKAAAHTRWAFEPDRAAATLKARKAASDRFLKQIDDALPGLPDSERYRRAESLQKAHFQKMALASAQSRRNAPARKRRRSLATEQGGV